MMNSNAHLDPEWLSAYLDDEVSLDERALAEQHLATCALCQQELATLRHTAMLLRRLPPVPLPRTFYVTEAMVAPEPAPVRGWQRWLPRFAPLGVVLAALLLMLVVVRPFPSPAAPEAAPAVAVEMGAIAAEETDGMAADALPPAASEMAESEAEGEQAGGAERSVSDTAESGGAEESAAPEELATLSMEATPPAPEAVTGTTATFSTTQSVTTTPEILPTLVPGDTEGVAAAPPVSPTDPIVTTEETAAGGREATKIAAQRPWGWIVAPLLLLLLIVAVGWWRWGRRPKD